MTKVLRGGKVIIGVLLTLSTYEFINRVFLPKESFLGANIFCYDQQPENTIDVLCMGSSHSGMNIDVSSLWNEYGISGFNLWHSGQSIDMTYRVLIEALKKQHPKVLVLEVFAATFDWDQFLYHLQFRDGEWGLFLQNVNQLKYGLNKLDAVMKSVGPANRINYFLGLPEYHTRYSNLGRREFLSFEKDRLLNLKGSSYYYESEQSDDVFGVVNGISEIQDLDPKIEDYLKSIIFFCHEKKIPVVLIKSASFYQREELQPRLNRVAQIAKEYNIPFINYNLIDRETDISYSDTIDGSHLNAHGSRKIGKHLADYIATHYDLPDHRGDPRYASWDAFVKNTQTEWLQNEWELSEWFSLVKDSGESVLLVKNGNKEAPELLSMLSETLGIPLDEFENKDYAVWVSENPKEQPFTDRYTGSLSLETFINSEKFYFDFYDGLNFVYKDQGIGMIEDPDWLAVVYDQESGKTMDVITINSETGEFAHLPAERDPNTL